MPRQIDTRHAGYASASKRLRKSTAITAFNTGTGVFTVAAGWLNDLAPGDTVDFSGLTGGSAIDPAATYFLAGKPWALGATTFQVSLLPGGPVLTGGSALTVGTVSTGQLTAAADGVLSGNYVSPDSPAGR